MKIHQWLPIADSYAVWGLKIKFSAVREPFKITGKRWVFFWSMNSWCLLLYFLNQKVEARRRERCGCVSSFFMPAYGYLLAQGDQRIKYEKSIFEKAICGERTHFGFRILLITMLKKKTNRNRYHNSHNECEETSQSTLSHIQKRNLESQFLYISNCSQNQDCSIPAKSWSVGLAILILRRSGNCIVLSIYPKLSVNVIYQR